MKGMRILAIAAVISWLLQLSGATAAREAALPMQDFFTGQWPSRASWSPDGRYVSFLSTDWSEQNVFVMPADGGEPRALTSGDGFVGGPSWDSVDAFGSWSRDSRRMAFSVRGDVRVAGIPDGRIVQIGRASPESEVRFSPIDDSVAFVRDGEIVIADIGDGVTREVTRDARVGSSFMWSPDGRLLAGTISEGGRRSSASPPFLGPLLSVNWSVRGTRHVAIIDVRSGAVRVVRAETPQGAHDVAVLDWAPDSRKLLIEQRALNLKERSLRLVDVATLSTARMLYQQTDAKHLATNNQMAAFSPDGKAVLFTSDESGWNHLYRVEVSGGRPHPITEGAYEVSFPAWSADGRSVSFASTQGGPAERHLFRVSAVGGSAVQITQEPGVNTMPMPSPDGRRLLFLHADANRLPDYWTLEPSSAPHQITRSMAPALRAETWQPPRIVSYTSKGGLRIAAQLFMPAPFDRSRTYPAVVQVHEASAMNQHVFRGLGPQKNHVGWYGWHQRLAQRGHVVLNIDYRGSFGYGRDFRTADHLVMGQDPLEDVAAGVEFLRTLGNVDHRRIAAVGLSAGGRMVLSLLGKYPDTFAAGVDLAGIYDYLLPGGPWDTRNPWTRARLDTPDAHPEAYRDASPKTFVANIRTPLLILHGTADTNVPVTHSLALIEDLVALGKRFDFAVYPGEVHFFARKASWLDAFDRIERFLDRQLSLDRSDHVQE